MNFPLASIFFAVDGYLSDPMYTSFHRRLVGIKWALIPIKYEGEFPVFRWKTGFQMDRHVRLAGDFKSLIQIDAHFRFGSGIEAKDIVRRCDPGKYFTKDQCFLFVESDNCGAWGPNLLFTNVLAAAARRGSGVDSKSASHVVLKGPTVLGHTQRCL